MIRVTVDSIRVSLLTQHRVVVLRETDSRRYLPIWIGPFEADAIALALQGHEPQRPLTHDLLKSVIADLGGAVSRILVSDISDNTFFARIVVDHSGDTIEIDARPSDAIALAVRSDVPIFVEDHVLNQAGVLLDDDEQQLSQPQMPQPSGGDTPEPEVSDESLDMFRNFINQLENKPDDPNKGPKS
jgi:uncharacterized protein